ncbi:hypothetical protein N22_036 [Idiomarinaceae phage 1N2-2]|nr:hypothetical protein N22_036 [Idiomarinaceae phage 1N2-2]AIM40738.1 hypothetical protein N22_036 [Idiomarinaceae phage 1N2-2]
MTELSINQRAQRYRTIREAAKNVAAERAAQFTKRRRDAEQARDIKERQA